MVQYHLDILKYLRENLEGDYEIVIYGKRGTSILSGFNLKTFSLSPIPINSDFSLTELIIKNSKQPNFILKEEEFKEYRYKKKLPRLKERIESHFSNQETL